MTCTSCVLSKTLSIYGVHEIKKACSVCGQVSAVLSCGFCSLLQNVNSQARFKITLSEHTVQNIGIVINRYTDDSETMDTSPLTVITHRIV